MRKDFMPLDELAKYLKEYGFTLVSYDEPEKVTVSCERGHIKQRGLYHIKVAKCKECKKENRLKTVEEDIKNKGYTLLNEYKNNKTKLQLICKNGHKRECTYESFKIGECRQCLNLESVKNLIHEIENKGYRIITPPKNARDKVKAVCVNGHTREAKAHNYLLHDCPYCKEVNLKKDFKFCKSVFESRGFTLLEEEYVNCKTFMRYKCSCGRESLTTLDIILHSNIDSCTQCKGEKTSGENHHNWNPNLTDEERQVKRNYPEYTQWRSAVYKRDNYTCQCCEQRSGEINAHHLYNYSSHDYMRTDLRNGITLCVGCHDEFHKIYTRFDNDIYELQEYFDDVRTFIGLPLISIESIVERVS